MEDLDAWLRRQVKEVPRMRRTGVIHVGAHIGHEWPAYEALGLKRQLWIEPMPDNYAQLIKNIPKRPEVRSFQVACADENTRRTMVVSKFNMTHSLRRLKRQVELHPQHAQIGTIDVDVVRLDDLMGANGLSPEDYSLMVVDTQGSELDTLRGAVKAVSKMDCIHVEVGTMELYEGMALDHEVDAWLSDHGFKQKEVIWFGPKIGGKPTYGDAFYVRKGL